MFVTATFRSNCVPTDSAMRSIAFIIILLFFTYLQLWPSEIWCKLQSLQTVWPVLHVLSCPVLCVPAEDRLSWKHQKCWKDRKVMQNRQFLHCGRLKLEDWNREECLICKLWWGRTWLTTSARLFISFTRWFCPCPKPTSTVSPFIPPEPWLFRGFDAAFSWVFLHFPLKLCILLTFVLSFPRRLTPSSSQNFTPNGGHPLLATIHFLLPLIVPSHIQAPFVFGMPMPVDGLNWPYIQPVSVTPFLPWFIKQLLLLWVSPWEWLDRPMQLWQDGNWKISLRRGESW